MYIYYMKKDYLKLLKNITETETLEQLKEVVSKVNNFVKENKLKPSSDEFQKMEKFIKIVLLKLKTKERQQSESKTNRTIIITEEQYNRLFT